LEKQNRFAILGYLTGKKKDISMIQVSSAAEKELKQVLTTEQATGKHLIIYFQGHG